MCTDRCSSRRAPTLNGATGTFVYRDSLGSITTDFGSARTVTAELSGSIVGRTGVEVTMTVPFYIADTLAPGQPGSPVLNPANGDQSTVGNNVRVTATSAATDDRDSTTTFTFDPAGDEAVATAKNL